MSDEKVMNRWIVVVGGILVQLCLGAIYAWTAFTPNLSAKRPADFVNIYGPRGLGIETSVHSNMMAAIKGPDARIKEIQQETKKARKEGNADAVKSLDASKAQVLAEIDAIVTGSVSKDRLDGMTFAFSKTRTQIIFSLGLLSFAVIMALVAGKWQKKVGPRIVALTGGIVLGIGYVIAGLSGQSFLGVLLGVGLLGGAGIGLGYVCPIAALVKWFPDKKGLITGLAVAGFGFGALIWIKLTSGFKFGPIDLTPGWQGLYGMGWTVSQVFVLYGILFAALVVLGSLVLVNPPDGWKPAGWAPPTGAAASASGARDFTVAQMVATPQYWSLFFMFVVGAMAGLMVIGIIGLFGNDALTARGVAAVKANLIAGTAMGLFYALMNGLGRIIWGIVSDKIGRKSALFAMSLLQGIIMIAFYFIGGHEWGLYLGAAVIGFNFGGNFALFPAVTADFFGNKNVGTNYPWVFMAYGVGGVLGPILGGMMGDAQAWMWAFIPAGIACLIAAVIALGLRPPQAKEA